MKVRELINLLSKQDPCAEACIAAELDEFAILKVKKDGDKVCIVASDDFNDIVEIDGDFKTVH